MSELNINKNKFFSMITVDIAMLKMIIKDKLHTNKPLNVLGATGIGKTEVIKSVAGENNCIVVDLNTTCSDVLDVGGLPYRDKLINRLKFVLSENLPLEQDEEKFKDYDYIILFIDELPLAPRELQSVLYKMVQERLVRQEFLNKKVRIISAGNLKTDLGNHNEPPAPLKNREAHVYLKPDAAGWCEWAKNSHIHPSIIGFVEDHPQYIHVLATTKGQDNYKSHVDLYAFYTPRTWHNLSDDLWYAESEGRNNEYIRILIYSWIGALGSLFYEYYKNSIKLPKAKDIFSGEAMKRITHWSEQVDKSEYRQSLLLYLSYHMCYGLSKMVEDLQRESGNEYSYVQNKDYNKCADNAFIFLEAISSHDAALLQSFYYNFSNRYNLSHIMNGTSRLFQFLASPEMKEHSEYLFTTGNENGGK